LKAKHVLLLIFLLLTALVLSALVAQATAGVAGLKWLTWGDSVGFDAVSIDLSVIQLSFSFHMQINVLQIICLIAALLIFRRLT